MFSDFWNRISQILLLAAPVLLMLLGIDIIPIVDGFGEIITIYLPAIIVIVKDIVMIIRGWFAASEQGFTFTQYRVMKPAKIYELHARRAA